MTENSAIADGASKMRHLYTDGKPDAAKAARECELRIQRADDAYWRENDRREAEQAKHAVRTPAGPVPRPTGPVMPDFVTRDGRVIPNGDNIRLALDAKGYTVEHNTFADTYHVDGDLLDDAAMVRMWLDIESTYHFRPGKELFYDVVQNEARRIPFHPVRERLATLQREYETELASEDGIRPMLDEYLWRYCGAERTPFNIAAGRIWMIAAVRRIRKPGAKFDELPVFESPQGWGKSTLLSMLAMRRAWFTDNVPLNADSKVIIEQTRGKWIVEIPEMSGMRKAEVEHVKAFLSRGTDESRMAYGRIREEVPRAFICAGTTNSECYLKDLTGNRRFWPIKLGKIDMVEMHHLIPWLWGEAAMLEAKGASIRLAPELWGDAAKAQEARMEANPYADVLARAFEHVKAGRVTKADVYDLCGVKPDRIYQGMHETIGAAMLALGWEPSVARIDGKPARAFVKGATHEQTPLTVSWSETLRRYAVEPVRCAGPFHPGRP